MADKTISEQILLVPLPGGVETSGDAGYEPLRGDENRGHRGMVGAATARLSELSSGLKEFMEQLDILFKDAPPLVGGFGLNEVQISAGVTVNGKFVLFGVGAEGGVTGGLTFVFKKGTDSK